jgi:hypothetical protein
MRVAARQLLPGVNVMNLHLSAHHSSPPGFPKRYRMQRKDFSKTGSKNGSKTGISFLALTAVLLFAAGCSKSDQQEQQKAEGHQPATQQAGRSPFNTPKLPRVAGAKEIYASDGSTIFSTPNPVAQTAGQVEKALGADGWVRYGRPHATQVANDSTEVMSFKKGPIGLDVLVTLAPAQGNQNGTQAATSNVQYSETTLANDLPLPKDATDVEFDPNRPLLMLVSSQSASEALDFYRKQLAPLGWALWSRKLASIAPAGSESGEMNKTGARAYYIQGDAHFGRLVIEPADGGRIKITFETRPMSDLQEMQREFLNSDTTGTDLVDVASLPQLDDATIDPAHTSANELTYAVDGAVPETVAAIKKLLAANGWQFYVQPFEKPNTTLLNFKKGAQGLYVSFTMNNGRADSSKVEYRPNRLRFALAGPADASALIYDDNRPYLGFVTAGAPDATFDFLRRALTANGWSPLSQADAAKQWPDAKLEETNPSGAFAYFIRGTQHPIVVSVKPRSDGGSSVEIKTPVFAEPQTLEASEIFYGLPVPRLHPTAGGTGGDRQRSVNALVPAEVSSVLAFYRRELGALNWTEDSQGTTIAPDKATVNFTSPDGPATLTLDHQYDLTSVSLVLHINKPAPQAQVQAHDRDPVQTAADMLKEAEAQMRAAGMTPSSDRAAQAAAAAANTPDAPVHLVAKNDVPIAMPDNAENVDFNAPGGNLEFDSASSVQGLADAYRAAMKQQGWSLRPSVINKPNMVVLDFAKGRDSLEFTLLRMGDKTNVSVEGAAMKITAKPQMKQSTSAPAKAVAPADIEAEDSNGLPVPKDHVMSEGTKTPFRREVKATGVPYEIADLLGFYRGALDKLGWKESGSGASASADHAAIGFTTPDGPARLELDRHDDKTDIDLVVKNPDAAAKAGMLPKQGQVKILFGNVNPAAETITFANKPIKVEAGAGAKGPDGPTLDVPPGKYSYSIKRPGQPAQSEEIVVGANETWGLMIGPGGVLPLQAY